MHEINMFDRSGALSLEGFSGSGADWLDLYKPYIDDGRTVVCSPHKVCGPENNDVILQLRKRGINKVILGRMSANLCVESHIRPEHAGEVFKTFYYISDVSATTIYVIGGIEMLIIIEFLVGFKKKWTYGAVLVLHAISTIASYRQYFAPFEGRIFFSSLHGPCWRPYIHSLF